MGVKKLLGRSELGRFVKAPPPRPKKEYKIIKTSSRERLTSGQEQKGVQNAIFLNYSVTFHEDNMSPVLLR